MPARRVFRSAVVACLAAAAISGPAMLASNTAAARVRERPDRTWMVDGKVYALARANGRLYVGGRFSRLLPPRGSDATPIRAWNLAAFDLSSGAPIRSWRPRVKGASRTVHALEVMGNRVYVGGSFGRLAGTPVDNLGAVKRKGRAVSGFRPQVSGRVFALLAGDDLLYAGGAFGRVDGRSRSKLAAFRFPGGGLSAVWRPRAVGGAVRDLEFAPGRGSIFVAGAFPAMAEGGQTFDRESLAKVDAGDGSLTGWEANPGAGDPQTGWSVDVAGNRLHGGFGRGPNFAASYEANGDQDGRIWRLDVPGNVQTVELSKDGSRLFLGGHFGLAVGDAQVCGKDLRGLLSVDPATGDPFCDWVPQIAPFDRNFDGPWTMLAVGDHVWVGGGWGKVGGLSQRGLARFEVG